MTSCGLRAADQDQDQPPAGEETRLAFISATVYGHSRTFLRWSSPGAADGREFTAWSNLDFNHFSAQSIYRIQAAGGAVRDDVLFLALSNEVAAAAPPIPALPDLADGGPAFTLVQGDPAQRAAIQIIADLHTLYRTQGPCLAATLRERMAVLPAPHPPGPQKPEISFRKKSATPAAARSSSLQFQPLSDDPSPPPALELSIATDDFGAWNLSWQGAAGRSDFVQWSSDLATWTYAPVIESGEGVKAYEVDSTAPGMFLRLVHTDQATGNAKKDDFDGDKVSNWNEVLQGTDPFATDDDDLDGMPSDWEVRFLLDPHDPLDAAADRDGDGISNLAEFTAGTDPTDFYNGGTLRFTVISGDNQYAEPDTFSAAPLVVEFRINGVLRANSPVRIETAHETAASISLASDGSDLASRIDTSSGPDGRITVFVKHGPQAALNYFYFSAGSEIPASRALSTRTASATTQVPSVYPPGTLGRDASDAVDNRLAGKNPIAAKPVFTLQNHAAATYLRNTSCWAYDLRQQMTCISPWNSMDGARRAGVAITPRHVLNAAHFPIDPGALIRFITADNTVVERTIVSRVIHPAYQPSPPYPDLAVYTLDRDLPPEITPCKMLPADFATALGPLTPFRPPALGLDQEENALVFDFGKIGATGSGNAPFFTTFYPPTLPAARSLYYENIVTGDSGNPAFLILHDSLALVTLWSTGSLGTFTTAHLGDLDSMISAADAQAGVSTGFQVQTIDLSGYLPFTP